MIFWIIKTNIRSSILSAFSLTIALVFIVIVVLGPISAADSLLEENLRDMEYYLRGSLYPANIDELSYDNLILLNETISNFIEEYRMNDFLSNDYRPFLDLEFEIFNEFRRK